MKIFILPVKKEFQPLECKLRYPGHSTYEGVEVAFYNWLHKNEQLITNCEDEADFFYLPVFWTNYYINHNFAKTGKEELRLECERVMKDDKRTFTLCQYDDGPMIDLGETILFLASRNPKKDLDIPLLCSPHIIKPHKRAIKKRWRACFVGRKGTHPIRKELYAAVRKEREFLFLNGKWGEKIFVNIMLRSYACLSPRGCGGSSFRFFEAMQMGVVPVHIGDNDIRPFKNFFSWNEYSFYFEDSKSAVKKLKEMDVHELEIMGRKAKEIYDEWFATDRWCEGVVDELEGNSKLR